MKLIITCEHGGNKIPKTYQRLFKKYQKQLSSHEGLDIGALRLAKSFAKRADYFFYTEISRLLVDLNRSIGHPRLFSDAVKKISSEEKKTILAQYYFPYRNQVTETIKSIVVQGEGVIHLSIHTFSPLFAGKKRSADIGLLYDPRRISEKSFCHLWRENFYHLNEEHSLRYNYPYLGIADGLVTFLRKEFSERDYLGIELEVNQKNITESTRYNKLKKTLITAFYDALIQL